MFVLGWYLHWYTTRIDFRIFFIFNIHQQFINWYTVWKVSKYGVFSGLYFPVFGPEKTSYLDTFQAVVLKSKCKFFADDTYLFSLVRDIDTSANDLGYDLEKISWWVFQWEKKFNPDPIKQVQEIICSKKKAVSIHPVVYLNNTLVNSTATHEHLGMIRGPKLNNENHLQSIFNSKQDHWSFEKTSNCSCEKTSGDNL